MITPEFVRMMTAYNAEMNRRIYTAAAQLTDEQRKAERGVFWKSLHGTLNHLLWGDHNWMSRFDNWAKPPVALKQSDTLHDDFATLRTGREETDARLKEWAARVDNAWLAQDQIWYSGAAKRDMAMARGILMPHFFNHQTHHRGQAHAVLTGYGIDPGETDLFLLVDTF